MCSRRGHRSVREFRFISTSHTVLIFSPYRRKSPEYRVAIPKYCGSRTHYNLLLSRSRRPIPDKRPRYARGAFASFERLSTGSCFWPVQILRTVDIEPGPPASRGSKAVYRPAQDQVGPRPTPGGAARGARVPRGSLRAKAPTGPGTCRVA